MPPCVLDLLNLALLGLDDLHDLLNGLDDRHLTDDLLDDVLDDVLHALLDLHLVRVDAARRQSMIRLW